MEIDKYLFENNNVSISDLEIDLKKTIKIDNNLFGYIVSNFYVTDIIGCDTYQLYLDNYGEIQVYSILNLDDKIKVVYTIDGDIFQTVNCTIQYYLSVTEPDIETYNNYTEYNEYEDEGALFEKNHYNGKLAYYNVLLNKELTIVCGDNCDLCLKENTSYCITCKSEFSMSEDNTTKICKEVEKTDINEEKTDITTDINEKEKTDITTDINEKEKTDI